MFIRCYINTLDFKVVTLHYTNTYNNSSVNTNLIYANFTNTQFEKVPIPHLAWTMKLVNKWKYEIMLLITWLRENLVSRTKSSMNQGVGV